MTIQLTCAVKIPALNKKRKIILPAYDVSKDISEKNIWYHEAMVRPYNATLTQEIHAITNCEIIYNYLLEACKREIEERTITTTGLLYERSSEKIVERPAKVYPNNVTKLWTFSEGRQTRIYKAKIPKTSGYVIPFTNKQKGMASVYDVLENGGFPREVVRNRKEAEKKFEQAGLDPRFVSYFWRRDRGNSGIARVCRYTYVADYGPFAISSDREPGDRDAFSGIRAFTYAVFESQI